MQAGTAATSLSRPAEDYHLFAKLLPRRGSQPGAKQVDAQQFIAQGSGYIGKQLSRTNHHAQIGGLIADDIGELCAGA